MELKENEQKLIDRIEDICFKEFRKMGEVLPYVYFMTSGSMAIMPCRHLMTEESSTERLNDIIKLITKENNADMVCFVCESYLYMQTFKTENRAAAELHIDELFKKHGKISNMPERIEVIMILLWTPEINNMITLEIKRIPKPELIFRSEMITSIKQLSEANFQNPFLNDHE